MAAVLLVLIVIAVTGCSGTSEPVAKPPAIADGNGPSPTGTPEPMARSTPVRVQIPGIGVDATLKGLGLRDNGTMEVPPDGRQAGWYTGGPAPGELGPAVIAGHVDWGGHPGVFYRLRALKPDDQITVTREDGTAVVFRVTRVEQFPKSTFPTKLVYGNLGHAGLRLITCGGSFDRQARSYGDNVIAFAELINSRLARVESR